MWIRFRQTIVEDARSSDGGEIGGRVTGERARVRTAVTV
jgi:hypothetical protein